MFEILFVCAKLCGLDLKSLSAIVLVSSPTVLGVILFENLQSIKFKPSFYRFTLYFGCPGNKGSSLHCNKQPEHCVLVSI